MLPVQTVLEFTITSFATSEEARKEQLDEAFGGTNVLDTMSPAPSLPGVDNVTSAMNAMNTISATWVPLLESIKLFTVIVDGISEVWFKSAVS
jgi:hypothetical protein